MAVIYTEHVIRFSTRKVVCAEPVAVWICCLPEGQTPSFPFKHSEGMQRLDRGHDWSWRAGTFRLSAVGYAPDDVVRLWFAYGQAEHCGQVHPLEAVYCGLCGERI